MHGSIIPYNVPMTHDDDADGFLGITYIPHGSDHQTDNSKTEPNNNDTEKPKHTKKHAHNDSDEIAALHHELEVIESRLQAYEVETEERLKHLERMAGHPITAEEKVFRIQEES